MFKIFKKEKPEPEMEIVEIEGISSDDRFATSKLLTQTMEKTGLNSFENIISEDNNDFLSSIIANEIVNMQAEVGEAVNFYNKKSTKPEEHDVSIDLKKMIKLTKSHGESVDTIKLPSIKTTSEKESSISLRENIQPNNEDVKTEKTAPSVIKLR